MCGRYAIRTSVPEIARILGIEDAASLAPRYNVAPTQDVPVCRAADGGGRRLDLLRWGLVPRWAKDARVAYRLINARAETVAEKPSFRDAFRRRRCVLPADGWYEWRREGDRKQPYLLELEGGRPFFFAGLWERWERDPERPIESCTIVTTSACPLAAEVHDRMPVLLDAAGAGRWLDPGADDRAALESLLVPYPGTDLRHAPVSTLVNNPRNDEPRCAQPIAPGH